MAGSGHVLEECIHGNYSEVRKVSLGLEPWSPMAHPAHSSQTASLEIRGPTCLTSPSPARSLPPLSHHLRHMDWVSGVGLGVQLRGRGSSDLISLEPGRGSSPSTQPPAEACQAHSQERELSGIAELHSRLPQFRIPQVARTHEWTGN